MENLTQLCLFYIWLLSIISSRAQDVTVNTNTGTIIGEFYRGTYDSTPFTVSRFLGIPFAEAPIGERRFQKPVKKAPLTEPLVAKSMPPACAQVYNPLENANNFNEDCLYLNVLVPGDSIDSNNRKAVLIWIYGGGFQYGSLDLYTSPTFAGLNDVILVTLNYRVGIYGFMSTGESHMTGNNGLWDQHMAIQWVHDHIAKFGGDPNQVTIFGESAGSVSVVFQALYKGDIGLFKGVIAQSGTATSRWTVSEQPRKDFNDIVNRTNCLVGTIPTVIKCLQNKTTTELESAVGGIRFYPVFDSDFVVVHPSNILKNETEQASEMLKSFGQLDVIFGVTSDEGGYFLPMFDPFFMSPVEAATNPTGAYNLVMFETLVVPTLMTFNPSVPSNEVIKNAIVHTYVDWKDPSNKIRMRQGAINLISDINFNADVVHIANVHSSLGETGHTFFYVYDHQLSLFPTNRGFDGAEHAEDLAVVFGFDKEVTALVSYVNMNFTGFEDPATKIPAQEIMFSKGVMEYWTNFAKTG